MSVICARALIAIDHTFPSDSIPFHWHWYVSVARASTWSTCTNAPIFKTNAHANVPTNTCSICTTWYLFICSLLQSHTCGCRFSSQLFPCSRSYHILLALNSVTICPLTIFPPFCHFAQKPEFLNLVQARTWRNVQMRKEPKQADCRQPFHLPHC